jgi:cytochrome c553
MALCSVCHEREAKIPDRNRPTDRTLRICRQCHADRLIGDLKTIMEQTKKK